MSSLISILFLSIELEFFTELSKFSIFLLSSLISFGLISLSVVIAALPKVFSFSISISL